MWPVRPSPGYEPSFGSSLARIGLLGVKNNCYLAHYHIIVSYHIIISHKSIRVKLQQSKLMALPVRHFYHIANEIPL